MARDCILNLNQVFLDTKQLLTVGHNIHSDLVTCLRNQVYIANINCSVREWVEILIPPVIILIYLDVDNIGCLHIASYCTTRITTTEKV